MGDDVVLLGFSVVYEPDEELTKDKNLWRVRDAGNSRIVLKAD